MRFTSRYFSLIIFGALALGFVWPAPGIWLKPYLMPLLMLMMFLSCLKMDFGSLGLALKDWWRYLIIMLFVFFVPAIFIFFFKGYLDNLVFVGLIIAAAAPSAVSSVFLSDLFGGEPPKALLAVTLTHLVSPILMPLVIWLFVHKLVAVDFLSMLWLIVKLVAIPLFLAQLVKQFKWQAKPSHYSSTINTYLLVVLIWGIIAPARAVILGDLTQFVVLLVVVVFAVLLEIILSFWFGRTRREDITLSIVDSYKNFTLSGVMALSMFGPPALLGSAVYSVVNNLVLIPLEWWLKRSRRSR